jgi:pseudomonalisin
MLRRTAIVVLPLSLCLLLLPSAAWASTSTGTSWASTATQGLTLNQASNLGPIAGNTHMQVSLALPLRSSSALQAFIQQANTPGTSSYGKKLTPYQFKKNFSPTTDQVSAVQNYLQNEGFKDIHTSANNIYVTGSAPASVVESAFNTQIDSFLQKGQHVYANVTTAQVPSSLSSDVVSILGLNSIPMQLDPMAPDTSHTPGSYWAPQFQQAYDAGSKNGRQTPIAIMMEGDLTQVVKDLRQYEADTTDNGTLAKVGVSVVPVGIHSSDTAGLVEWDMDSQTSTGLAGSVSHLYLYDATSLTDGDVALEFNKWATQDVALAASASFGECEYNAWLDGFMVANDEVLSQAAAQGQTLFASAGDSGGFCAVTGLLNGVPVGEPDVNYPASSDYTVAVGGTTLYTDAQGNYSDETPWVAGGGGISYFEYQPEWQNGVTPPTGDSCLVQAPACLGRNLPDVAMDADFLLSAANFYNDGTLTSNGGTSLASPLALGAWARIETANRNKIGFASPSLYAEAGSAGFHDVTTGDTGPYPATPGWDFATGNGSFDIAQMASLIRTTTTITKIPVPSPACTLYYDGSGDAQPITSTGNVDSLDILSGGLSSDTTAGTLSATLLVKSLNDGPAGTTAISGTGDMWYALFNYQGTTFFLSAAYDPSTATSFSFGYGHIEVSPTGGQQFNPDGTATGTVDTTNGLITITAQLSDFGPQLSPPVTPPSAGSALAQAGAQTYAEIGTSAVGGLLEGADDAGPSTTDYSVGTNC